MPEYCAHSNLLTVENLMRNTSLEIKSVIVERSVDTRAVHTSSIPVCVWVWQRATYDRCMNDNRTVKLHEQQNECLGQR